MKRIANLYSKIVDKNNIQKAILYASKRKKDRKNVQKVLDNMAFCVDDIYRMLSTETYKPSPYYKVAIHDGVRKKERIIYKPKFYPDQCIHWSLMLQLEPIILKGMYYYCCGSVKNRGIAHGMKYIKKILVRDRKNTKYCLKLDIKKFYPSINKEILKKKFRYVLKDGQTLNLINIIIDSAEEGVPIRKLLLTMVCKFLFARFGPLYQGGIESTLLYKVYG